MNRVTGARLLFAAVLMSGAGFAQANFFGAKMGGVDLTGDWFPVRGQDAGLGTAAGKMVDYGGLPINEASRLYGLAWNASRITLATASMRGVCAAVFFLAPGNYRFWEERDPHTQALVAIQMYGQIAEGTRTIWMDGRPHPPAYAQHTLAGFSTGKYEGNMLVHTRPTSSAAGSGPPEWLRAIRPRSRNISSGTATASRIFPLPPTRFF